MPKAKISVTIKRACSCDVDLMTPQRYSANSKYKHICLFCRGGITTAMHDKYNQYYGFSGWDEYEDLEELDNV